jgi:hypothetical protein
MTRPPARSPPLQPRLLGPGLALGLLAAASAPASTTCTEIGTPAEGRVEIEITIDEPLAGQVFQVENACSTTIDLAGTYSVDADYSTLFDFYVVFDSSGSTSDLSGSDVDGNGSASDLPEDSIHHAEITAAQRFIEALDPLTSRVAVIGFSTIAEAHVDLTADLENAISSLERLKSLPPNGGTIYSVALAEVERQVTLFGDPINRTQRALFLSDGRPNAQDLPFIDPAAERLAAIPVRVDTFSLAVPAAAELQSIADITDGIFTFLANPGDILDVLPRSASDPGFEMGSSNRTTGDTGDVSHPDEVVGEFSGTATLQPGPNQLDVTITVPGTPDTVLTCSVVVQLDVTPGPSPIGDTLRVAKAPQEARILSWSGASDLRVNDEDIVLRAEAANELFPVIADGLTGKTWLDGDAAAALLFYDVRRSNCDLIVSED